MTVLSAVRDAARQLHQTQPSSLFGANDAFAAEMATLANESATAITAIYDWQKFTRIHTLSGDGVTTSFSLPSDYGWMPAKAELQTSMLSQPYTKVADLDQWLYFQIHPEAIIPGFWIILGDLFQFNPAIPTGVTVKFPYQSNIVVSGSQSSFTADTDTFLLPERLLTLDLIWRWKAQKGLDYAEPMRNFEMAMEQEISRDKGSRTLRVGTLRWPSGATTAYPRALG